MKVFIILLSLACWSVRLSLAQSAAAPSPSLSQVTATHHHSVPQRIVSLDYCADQFLLGLVNDDSRIAGISRFAALPEQSLFAQRAVKLPILPRIDSESIMAAKPDLVLGSPYEALTTRRQLEEMNIRYFAVDQVEDFDQAMELTMAIGQALGEEITAKHLIEEARKTWNFYRDNPPFHGESALYLVPGGYSAAGKTYIDAIFQQAGLVNLASMPLRPEGPSPQGWTSFSQERLIGLKVDYIFFSFLDNQRPLRAQSWQNLVADSTQGKFIPFPARFWLCANWTMPQAVAALQQVVSANLP